MNKEKILKLCDEIENTLSDAWNSGSIEYELAGHIVSFAKKITEEITTEEITTEEITTEEITAERSVTKMNKAKITKLCNEIEDEVTDIAFNSTHKHIYDCCESIREYLKAIAAEITTPPTVESEPVRHGRWDEMQCFSEHGVAMADYECTNCGGEITKQRGYTPKWCEHCGARMYGGADNGRTCGENARR